MSGKFIVFEGVEGSGKSTQIQLAAEWLKSLPGKNQSAIVTREPGGTNLGRQIRQMLLNDPSNDIGNRTELLLYGADRAQHVESIVKPHLKLGDLVLCDRFTDSTIAYQGYGRGFDRDEIDRVNQLATGGLQSDLTFWLDLDVTIGLQRVGLRGQPDRMERANLDFHQRVRQGYQELANSYPNRIVRIDADRSATVIQMEIQTILTQQKWFDLGSADTATVTDARPPK
ncbi:dTMP kinase [Chamaesiphon minutus]|uniref:Thymidylate kinase n=1 Tax=Chamaesiphon minutus (strain ATCC 27169 / PCC 6605) TaxID=1173020 RepID=K9UIA1_CHAP6|nr:dTMP kinase [Chamaesiphon minutus]AFY94368.1 thymidylate kinase [Chamaesiphon minutus PCC 6605]